VHSGRSDQPWRTAVADRQTGETPRAGEAAKRHAVRHLLSGKDPDRITAVDRVRNHECRATNPKHGIVGTLICHATEARSGGVAAPGVVRIGAGGDRDQNATVANGIRVRQPDHDEAAAPTVPLDPQIEYARRAGRGKAAEKAVAVGMSELRAAASEEPDRCALGDH